MTFWPSDLGTPLVPLKYVCSIDPEILPESTDPERHLNYVDIGNVTLEDGITGHEVHTFREAPSRARKIVRRGDTIVSTVRTYLRAIAHIEMSAPEYIVSTGFAVLRPKTSVDPRYLHRIVQSEPFVESVVAHSTGVSYPAITSNKLGNLVIPLPDLRTQQRIADFLDRETARIDELIWKKERMRVLLKERLASRLESMTFQNEDCQTWTRIPFKWICRILGGQVDPSDEDMQGLPLIAPNHIESRTGVLLQLETAEEQQSISGKYAFPEGVLLYSKIRPALAKACIAPSAGLCSADMYAIIPDARLLPEYLLMQLLSSEFTDWATLESMRVAMPKINRETLGRFRLLVPRIEVQRNFISAWHAEHGLYEMLNTAFDVSVAKLRELRSALITGAVTGQIDVDTWRRSGDTERHIDEIKREVAGA